MMQAAPATAPAQITELSGVETIDLSVVSPAATAHLAPGPSQSAAFDEAHSAWLMDQGGAFMQFDLNLAGGETAITEGVALVLQLCGAADPTSTYDVTVAVGDTNVVENFSPQAAAFQQQSWYVDATNLQVGSNAIKVALGDVSKGVFLKSVSVMRFDIQPQELGNWCWCAVSTSTSQFYEAASPWTQSSLASAVLDLDCSNAAPACDQIFQLEVALAKTGNLALMVPCPPPGNDYTKSVEGPLTVAQIFEQINQARPVGARIGWVYGPNEPTGGGHYIMITGVGPDQNMIAVEDPISGYWYKPYASLTVGYTHAYAMWTNSYLTKPDDGTAPSPCAEQS